MADMKIQSTNTSVVEGGALRAEIAISDTPDTATAQELVVIRHTLVANEFPLLLEEIQFATLTHVHALLGRYIAELKEKTDRARRR